MNNKRPVLSFPSSRTSDIIIKILNYVKDNNLLETRVIRINENYKIALGLSDLSSSSIDNSIEWFEFFRLVEQSLDRTEFRITDIGYKIFDYYIKYNKFNLIDIYYMLINTIIPYKTGCQYGLRDRNYRVLEVMLKVFLYLNNNDRKLDSRKFDEVFYFDLNNENYKDYEEISKMIVNTSNYTHSRCVIDYLFSILEFFGVIQKEQSCIYDLTEDFKNILNEKIILIKKDVDDMNKDIPLLYLVDEKKISKLAYNNEFVSYSLIQYLFYGIAGNNIEEKYCGSGRGFLVQDILYFYQIDTSGKNRGIYGKHSILDVCNFLDNQKDDRYKKISSAIKGNDSLKENTISQINDKIRLNENERNKFGFNKIIYGIPGCGKSHEANLQALKLTNNEFNDIIRTTFYPDYTNSDFIGQIIPKIDDNDKNSVLYDIQEGPFTKALAKAIDNPTKNICLIVEEINRGNAAAIFGDLFQLLDRDKNGTSEYYITNYTISKYLQINCKNLSYDILKIRIPSNLYIFGTMNTSDQNVFTLDTAFKRRWTMEHISNDINKCSFANKEIPLLNVKWKDFVKGINDLIVDSEDDFGINGEDKQIGAYFISGQEWDKMDKLIEVNKPEEAAKIFAEKVLSYIWEDVAKLDKEVMFKKDYKRFDDVVAAFTKQEDFLNIDINKG